jgi:hypothetical protein
VARVGCRRRERICTLNSPRSSLQFLSLTPENSPPAAGIDRVCRWSPIPKARRSRILIASALGIAPPLRSMTAASPVGMF